MYQLTLELLPGDQDWDLLKDAIQIQMSNLSEDTEWYTLAQAEAESIALPGILESAQSLRYQFRYRLPEQYPADPDGDGPLSAGDPIGDELEQKVTSGISLLITGQMQ